jgi:ABC-type nitrate/sulfonate/bicarbonate transport systems, periplasmic components
MKKIAIVLLVIMLAVSIISCGEKAAPANISVIGLKGPTGMGMAKLMEDNANGEAGNNYTFTLTSAPDEVTAEVIKGTVNIAAVPINLAGMLYQKTNGEIQISAINTLGVLYIVENGNTINSMSDLEGKTIYATGQGSTTEYILNYLLAKNNINAEVIYKSEHSELVTLMAAGEVVLGMLPEPHVTNALIQNENLRIALDLTEEWEKVSDDDSMLLQGCIIVNKKFAEENKEAFNKFLAEYKASIEYVNANIDEASLLIEKFEIVPKAAIAKKALPNCNIAYNDGDQMKQYVNNLYQVFFDANPASIGGVMPDDGFFYKP